MVIQRFDTRTVRIRPRSPIAFGLALWFLALLAPGAAFSQACTHFLNASDGDDGNSGAQTAPVRSFEFAYSTFPGGSIVCVAAGEYFYGNDADGIQLVSSGKNMRFRLESFAGSSEVRFSEQEFAVDISSGTVTLEAGSSSNLVFGSGVVNLDNPDRPGLLNFLHTLRFSSGTLSFEGVDPVIESSVGNPGFTHPTNPDKVPPATAAVRWGNGNVTGVVTFNNGPRTTIFEGSDGSAHPFLLPPMVPGSALEFRQDGPISLDVVLDLTGVDLRFAHSGSVTFLQQITARTDNTVVELLPAFTGSVRFADQATLQGFGDVTWLDHSASGTITFDLLGLEASGTARTVFRNRGNGLIRILNASSDANPSGSAGHFLDLVNLSGTMELGSPLSGWAIPGSLTNAGTLDLSPDATLSDVSGSAVLTNTGTVITSGAVHLAGTDVTVLNEGDLTGIDSWRIHDASVLQGSGTWPDVAAENTRIRIEGSPILASLELAGSQATVGSGALPTITDVLTLGSGSALELEPDSRLFSTDVVLSATDSHIALPETATLSISGTFEGSSATSPFDSPEGTVEIPAGSDVSLNLPAGSEVPIIKATNATGLLRGGAQWNGFDLNNSVLTASATGSVRLNGVVLTSGAVLSVSSGQTLTLAGQTNLDLTSSLTLESDLPVQLETDLATAGGHVTFPAAGVRISGATALDAPTEHAIVLPSLLMDIPAGAPLTINGAVHTPAPLDLASGSIYLTQNGRMSISGNLTRSGGYFALESTGVLLLDGEASQEISGFSDSVLPGMIATGSDVIFRESITVIAGLRIAGGTTTLTAGSTALLQSDLTLVGGTLHLPGTASMTVGTNLNMSSGLLRLESGIMRIQQNAILAGGRVEAGASTWLFPSTENSVLLVETPTSLSSLQLGVNADVSKEGAAVLSIRNALALDTGAALTIGNGDIHVFRGSASPTVSNNGVLESRAGALVLRSEANGNTPTLSGNGRFGNVVVDLDSDSQFASLLAGTTSLRIGGTLTFLNGGIELNGASVVMETDGGLLPGLVYSLEDEQPANGTVDARGFRNSAGTLVFNAARSPFDLTYTGSVTTLYAPPAHIAASAVRDLSILTTDPINTPAIFGVSLTNAMTISGHFQLTEGAVLRLQQPLRLSGEIRRHAISGRISGPSALILSGQLNDFRLTGESSSIEFLRLEGQDTFAQSSLWLEGSIGVLESASGRFRFLQPENADISGSHILQRATMSGSEWTIETDLSVGSTGGMNQVSLDGTVSFSGAGNLILPEGGTVSASAASVFSASTSASGLSGDGFLVLSGTTQLTIPSPLPRLRIDITSQTSDDVFLESDLIISEHLVLTNGDIRLGGHVLELSGGQHWFDDDSLPTDGTADGIQGDVAQQPGSILISAEAELNLGGRLEIQDASVRIRPGAAESVAIRSISSVTHPVLQVSGGLRLESGTLDLGQNDWFLSSSAADMLIASGGSVLSTSLDTEGEVLNALADSRHGELVLTGSGNAAMVMDAATTMSALRLEGTVRMTSSGTLTLLNRLVFGQGGASLLTPAAGSLRLGDGAQVIRRGLGSLSHSPQMIGSIDLAYQLGDGSLTGLDTGFASGTLSAGLEVPSQAAVRELLVVAGAGSDGAHGVSLSGGLHVSERVNLLSGALRLTAAPLVLAPGARFEWSSPEARAASSVVLGSPLVAEGAYDLVVRQGFTRIDVPAAMMAASGGLRLLDIEAAHGSSSLVESVRLLGSFAADSVRIGSLARPIRVNLTGNTLTARQDLSILSGTVTSTQLASLVAIGDATLATGTDITGNIQTTIGGSLDLEGRVSGLVLDLHGNAQISGSLGATTRVTFSGSDQDIIIPASLSVGSMEARQSGLPAQIRIMTSGTSTFDLRVNNGLDLQGGVFVIQGGAMTLAETASVTRGSDVALPSYVQGAVKRPASEGSTREIIFPLGRNGVYLPVSLTFSQPLLSATTLEMNMVEPVLVSAVGLPIVDQEAIIRSVRAPQWTLTSTVDYAQAQPFSMAVTLPVDTGVGFSPVRLVRQPTGRADQGWILVPGTQLTAVTQEGVIVRAFESRGGLSPRGIHLGLGLPAEPSGPRTNLQWADFRPAAGSNSRTLTANGVPLLTLPAGQSATPSIPLVQSGDPQPIAFSASSAALTPQNTQLILEDGETGWLVLRSGPDGLPSLLSASAQVAGAVPSGSTDFVLLNALGEDLTLRDHLAQTTLANAASGGAATGRTPATTIYGDLLGQDETSRNIFRLALEPFDGATSLWVAFNGPSGAEMRLLGADGGILTPQITTDTEATSPELPDMIAWKGNYPNPFAGQTRVVLELAAGVEVGLEVFDLLGRRVRLESARWLDAGKQELLIDAEGLGSGVYLVRITAGRGADRRVISGRITLRR